MDRQWPKVIGIGFLVALVAVPIMLSQRTARTDDIPRFAVGNDDIQSAAVIVDTAFIPNRIHFTTTGPARLVFLRRIGGECNEAIVFPALNRTLELPIGEPVVIEFGRNETGRLEFTCRQQRMRGVVEFST